MSLERMAEALAQKGRYGDSEMVHMNPLEIAALEEMFGQEMTTNPETGQPEAFAFLIPLIASLAGGLGSAAVSKLVGGKKDPAPKQSEAGKYLEEQTRRRREESNARGIPIINLQSLGQQPDILGREQQHFTPAGVEPMKRFAAGGMMEPEEEQRDATYEAAVAALQGQHPNPEQAFDAFVRLYGPDALEQLAGPQMAMAGGGMVRGPGGGMDDMVTGSLNGEQKVLLSPEEFVIPADVVSGLGDGSSEAGARELMAMMARVRRMRTGKAVQPPKIDKTKVLPR